MDLTWKQEKPGVYRRPLSVFEYQVYDFFSAANWRGEENLLISFTTSFSLSKKLLERGTALELLQNAWKALRFNLPHLASLRDADDKVYVVPDEAALQQWVSQTFVTVESGKKPQDLLAKPQKEPPLPMLYYFPESSEVMFRCSHWRVDQDGAFSVMDRFYDLLVEQPQLKWGEEVKNLKPSFFEYLSLPLEPPPEVQAYAGNMFGGLGSILPSCGYTQKDPGPDTPPARSLAVEMRFTQQSTSEFIAAVKKSGHSITSAVHTALAWSAYELAPPQLKDRPQGGLTTRDMRRAPGVPLKESEYPLEMCAAPELFVLPPKTTYEDLAEYFRRKYRRVDFDPLIHVRSSDEIAKGFAAMATTPLPPGVPFPSSPWMSSLGVVENLLHREHANPADPEVNAHVQNIKVLVQLSGPNFAFWIYTWRNQMCFEVCYNEIFYDDHIVHETLQLTISLLEKHWGLKLNIAEQT